MPGRMHPVDYLTTAGLTMVIIAGPRATLSPSGSQCGPLSLRLTKPSAQHLTIPRRYLSAAEGVTCEVATSDPSMEILRAEELEFPMM